LVGETDGVVQEVEHDLANARTIDQQIGQPCVIDDLVAQVVLLKERHDGVARLIDHGPQARQLTHHGHACSIDPREIQYVTDQTFQVLRRAIGSTDVRHQIG